MGLFAYLSICLGVFLGAGIFGAFYGQENFSNCYNYTYRFDHVVPLRKLGCRAGAWITEKEELIYLREQK